MGGGEGGEGDYEGGEILDISFYLLLMELFNLICYITSNSTCINVTYANTAKI